MPPTAQKEGKAKKVISRVGRIFKTKLLPRSDDPPSPEVLVVLQHQTQINQAENAKLAVKLDQTRIEISREISTAVGNLQPPLSSVKNLVGELKNFVSNLEQRAITLELENRQFKHQLDHFSRLNQTKAEQERKNRLTRMNIYGGCCVLLTLLNLWVWGVGPLRSDQLRLVDQWQASLVHQDPLSEWMSITISDQSQQLAWQAELLSQQWTNDMRLVRRLKQCQTEIQELAATTHQEIHSLASRQAIQQTNLATLDDQQRKQELRVINNFLKLETQLLDLADQLPTNHSLTPPPH